MAAENDLPPAPCTFRYLVCASPRTGSNIITAALHDSGLGGVPFEYLHPNALPLVFRQFDRPNGSMRQYMRLLESCRTSQNGVFGIKVHFGQLVRILKEPEEQAKFVAPFDRVIYLGRRDKLAQAVSWHRANLTKVWKADSAELVAAAKVKEDQYDLLAINKLLTSVLLEERAWNAILANVDCHRIFYEDLVADYAGHMAAIGRFLGLDLPARSLREPIMKKTGDGVSRAWQERYLADVSDGKVRLEGAESRERDPRRAEASLP